jgi:hypothetical protein
MEMSLSNDETTKKQKTKKSKSKTTESKKSIDKQSDEEFIQEEEIVNIIADNSVNNVDEKLQNKNTDLIKKDESSEKDDSSETDNLSEKEDSSEKGDSFEKEEYIKKLDSIIECLTFINDKNLKDFNLTKDFFSNITSKNKKIFKSVSIMTINSMDLMFKENLVSLKNKDLKQNKPKKVINKENLAINKLMPTYPEVLKFVSFVDVSLKDATTVSRAQLIQTINTFVKSRKEIPNHKINIEGDKQRFNLIDELKVLFDFIKVKMLERGNLQTESDFPSSISYRQIMAYLKFCFPEVIKTK